MRGICLSMTAALLAASLARPAPVPPAKEGASAEAKGLALEVWLPPLGRFDPKKDKVSLPHVARTDLRKYASQSDEVTAAPRAIRQAQLLLWATSPAPPPRALAKEVEKLRKELEQAPSPLLLRVPIKQPAALGKQLQARSTQIARAISKLEAALDKLVELQGTSKQECPRVRAQLLYLSAAVTARLVYLDEHQGALGQMRREAPPHAAGDRAFELRAADRLTDSQSRNRHKTAAHRFQRLIKEHPATVWEEQARLALKVPLGVRWEAVQ